jgi:hypothetical protein
VLPSVDATVTWNCSRCAFSTSTRTITGTCTAYSTQDMVRKMKIVNTMKTMM